MIMRYANPTVKIVATVQVTFQGTSLTGYHLANGTYQFLMRGEWRTFATLIGAMEYWAGVIA